VSGAMLLLMLIGVVVSAGAVGIVLWLAPSLDHVEEDQSEYLPRGYGSRSNSWRTRLARWLRGDKSRQLAYRRDKRGRFRTIRRG
jgi:hypothetical protein